MIRRIYIEASVAAHPRTRAVLARYPQATRIECERYGEVFNPRSQNFRLQKTEPALILARKHGGLVLPAPPGYGLGGEHNHYFSHMLNCVYDCRYCFLQGMFRSANYVLFVNYEDFATAMDARRVQHPGEPCWFFSGYDCDSLAFEPLTGFVEWCLPYFAARPDAWLELRTKSTQIRALLDRPALANVVVAFSFTPPGAHAALEHKVPGVERRVAALHKLAARGWKLGLRFDPLIYTDDYEKAYGDLFEQVFAGLDADALHSVSFGAFRLPRAFFKTMAALYPDESLFAGPLETGGRMVGYRGELERELVAFCARRLGDYVRAHALFPCVTSPDSDTHTAPRGR